MRVDPGQRPIPATGRAQPIDVPERLGNVVLERELGRGGMGVVWRGRDEVLQRPVAVKFLLQVQARDDDPGFQEFLRGARAAAAVRHPGLTRIHHADIAAGVPYLVMECIDGPTLAAVLERIGPLEPTLAARVMAEISRTVAALHEQGIVHRDIKPENVLISPDGDLLLTDFGLACDRMSHAGAQRAESLAGTPQYMAPEMFEGNVSLRSDVYALGITAYELMAGESPYHGSLEEIRAAHEKGDLPLGPLRDRRVPEQFVDVILRLTNPNRMFRMKSARHVAEGFEAVMHHSPSSGRKPGAALLEHWRRAGPSSRAEPRAETNAGREAVSHAASAKRERSENREDSGALMPERSASGDMLGISIDCVHCGYDLTGSPVAAATRCPECGNTLAISISPDRLVFVNARWFGRLPRTLLILLIALLAPLMSFAAVLTAGELVEPRLEAAESGTWSAAGWAAAGHALMAVMIVFMLLLLFVPAFAAWRLTGEPAPGSGELRPRMRWWRYGILTCLAPMQIGMVYGLVATTIDAVAAIEAPMPVNTAVFGLYGIGVLGVLALVGWVVERIPERALARRIRWTVILGTAALAALAAGAAAGAVMERFAMAREAGDPVGIVSAPLLGLMAMPVTFVLAMLGAIALMNLLPATPFRRISSAATSWLGSWSERIVLAFLTGLVVILLLTFALSPPFRIALVDADLLVMRIAPLIGLVPFACYVLLIGSLYKGRQSIRRVAGQIHRMPAGARQRVIDLIRTEPRTAA